MECRRITSTLISVDYSNTDSLKRNQYISLINCKISRKETQISNIFRNIHKNHAYYGVITDKGTVIWYNILNTASFLKEYEVYATNEYTNIAEIITNPDGFTNSSTQGNKDHKTSAELKGLNNPNNAEAENDLSQKHALSSQSLILFSSKYIIVELPENIFLYDKEGIYIDKIHTGIDKVSSIYCTLCNKYLFMQLEKGMIYLYDIENKKFIYRKRHPVCVSYVFGNVFRYLRYFSVVKNTLIIGKVGDGEILLELSYPEEITCAATDVLHRKIAVGSVTGKLFYSRIDNEPAEFSETKISNNQIESVHFSNSGRFIFAIAKGIVSVIDTKDGKAVKTILSNSEKYFFTYTSSSNLHLQ